MISNKLKKLYLVTMVLIAAHGIEEYLSGFSYKDSFVFYFASLFESKEQVFYWSFHILWWLLVPIAFLLIFGGKKWTLILLTLFGVVYFFEMHHILKGLPQRSYYPGMVTAFLYPILGFFYWKQLIKDWRNV